VQVDFYQLAGTPPEQVIATISEKVLATGGRLIVIADDEGFLARLDRMLWDQAPTSFLPHGLAGGADDARQPVLLSTSPDAPNTARNILIADGVWRDSALSYDRAFYLFDNSGLQAARLAWKHLDKREGVDRRYWAQENGKWVNKG
jgi:DNA polymerase-3 subunit chi